MALLLQFNGAWWAGAFRLIMLVVISFAFGGPPASAGEEFYRTLPPGSTLPAAATCVVQVRATPAPEIRPENRDENLDTHPGTFEIDGASDAFERRTDAAGRTYKARTSARFVGSTMQIIRWSACLWGLNEDTTKARAVAESYWRQNFVGDQGHSFGLLQVKRTVHDGTYPAVAESSSANVNYANAWQRACLEGDFTWLGNGYRAGDEWGCVGAWFSGNWYDRGAQAYIAAVRGHRAARTWARPGF